MTNNSNNHKCGFDLMITMDYNSVFAIQEYGIITNPWQQHLQHIIKKFSSSLIIMGRKTWESMTLMFRSKNYHRTIVITASPSSTQFPVTIACNFQSALDRAYQMSNSRAIVLTSPSLCTTVLEHSDLQTIIIGITSQIYPTTIIDATRIKFPIPIQIILESASIFVSGTKGANLTDSHIIYYHNNGRTLIKHLVNSDKSFVLNPVFEYFKNEIQVQDSKTNPEQQYLDLVRLIVDKGTIKTTRNGLTRSIFGHQLRYDLSEGFPLLTVKKSYPKAIFEELMWMIRGQTDVRILQNMGIRIWDGNSSAQFLRDRGLKYREGDIGPGYGFQMRYSGATYIDCETDYTGQGIDQIQNCIDELLTNPSSRRLVIDLWNPKDLEQMALPPCHMVYNFGVDLYHHPIDTPKSKKRGRLNCHLFQRSWDVLLGWNTSTAALLTCLLANHCDLDPGYLIHSISDIHIYQNHIDSGAISELLNRKPRLIPQLNIKIKRPHIEDYVYADLVFDDYYPSPPIHAKMIA